MHVILSDKRMVRRNFIPNVPVRTDPFIHIFFKSRLYAFRRLQICRIAEFLVGEQQDIHSAKQMVHRTMRLYILLCREVVLDIKRICIDFNNISLPFLRYEKVSIVFQAERIVVMSKRLSSIVKE